MPYIVHSTTMYHYRIYQIVAPFLAYLFLTPGGHLSLWQGKLSSERVMSQSWWCFTSQQSASGLKTTSGGWFQNVLGISLYIMFHSDMMNIHIGSIFSEHYRIIVYNMSLSMKHSDHYSDHYSEHIILEWTL